jgi:ATP-dependent helicase/DNAse subunit B
MATPAISIDSMVNQTDSDEETEQPLLHPNDFVSLDENGSTISKIPYPTHLSPSSAMEFRECPQSFLFQYLYNIRQPTNLVLTKGSMCHKALEHIFDLDPPDRTLENLQNMLRVKWNEQRLKEEYALLFETEDGERDIEAEREWGQSALQLLENYYRSEDPKTVVRPNPYKREVWVSANLTADPSLGITSTTGSTTQSNNDDNTFLVRGIVDRLDMVKLTSRSVALRVVDYKTGKAPTLKYSQSMNQQIFEKNFWQLKIYALLLREMQIQKNNNKTKGYSDTNGMDLRYLKLHYLNSEKGRAKVWEMDLGETQEIRDEVLQDVHQELSQIWTDINNLVAAQDPKAFVHCDRSFCYCHTCRERFVPGTVFDRSRDMKR